MNLLTSEHRAALVANTAARLGAQVEGAIEPDPYPVVRFFNPIGNGIWLATEIDEDDILFGLADLGFGSPELGYFALAELEAIRLPMQFRIERDLTFCPRFPLSFYTEAACRTGSLIIGEHLLGQLAA